MRRIACLVMLLAAAPALAAPANSSAAPRPATHKHVHVAHKTKHAHHYRSPYGFLPGYEPPEMAEARREREYRESHPCTFYGPA